MAECISAGAEERPEPKGSEPDEAFFDSRGPTRVLPEGETSREKSCGAHSADEAEAEPASLPLLVPRVESHRYIHRAHAGLELALGRTFAAAPVSATRDAMSEVGELQQWTLRATREQRCHWSLEASHAAAQQTHAAGIPRQATSAAAKEAAERTRSGASAPPHEPGAHLLAQTTT